MNGCRSPIGGTGARMGAAPGWLCRARSVLWRRDRLD